VVSERQIVQGWQLERRLVDRQGYEHHQIQWENTTVELAWWENLRVNCLHYASTGAVIKMHISGVSAFAYPSRHRSEPSQLGYTAAKTKTPPHEEMVMSHPIPSCRVRLFFSSFSHQFPTLMKPIRVPCSGDIPSDEGLVSIASHKLHSLRYGIMTHR
jgi:hypothetical protein